MCVSSAERIDHGIMRDILMTSRLLCHQIFSWARSVKQRHCDSAERWLAIGRCAEVKGQADVK